MIVCYGCWYSGQSLEPKAMLATLLILSEYVQMNEWANQSII
jgi:hypothetical protein